MGDFLMYERAGVVVLDPLGTMLAFAVVILIGFGVANSRLPRGVKQLVYWALAFRVFGSVARYVVLFGVYNGSGDARDYYTGGLANAAALWNFNFAPLFRRENWWQENWWGTQFVYFPSSFVQALLGPSMIGGFIMFSLFAFLGLVGFAIAFKRVYPHVPLNRYARWLFFFPALWYWPSSIGKEAILMCGLGIAIWGYVGTRGRINWLLLFVGLFIVFGVRPEVAAVVCASLLIAHWLSLLTGRWTLVNTLQAIVLVVAGAGGTYLSLSYIGVEQMDMTGIQTYMANEGGRQLGGGSSFEAPAVALSGVPFALINILFRPFPWEGGGMAVLSSVEILIFWVVLFRRRRSVMTALKFWRHDALLRFAIPFILMYAISLGMVIGNMGVVARQRIFLFPFLFLLIEAVPRKALAGNARMVRGPFSFAGTPARVPGPAPSTQT